jgi:hypothetical protein
MPVRVVLQRTSLDREDAEGWSRGSTGPVSPTPDGWPSSSDWHVDPGGWATGVVEGPEVGWVRRVLLPLAVLAVLIVAAVIAAVLVKGDFAQGVFAAAAFMLFVVAALWVAAQLRVPFTVRDVIEILKALAGLRGGGGNGKDGDGVRSEDAVPPPEPVEERTSPSSSTG